MPVNDSSSNDPNMTVDLATGLLLARERFLKARADARKEGHVLNLAAGFTLLPEPWRSWVEGELRWTKQDGVHDATRIDIGAHDTKVESQQIQPGTVDIQPSTNQAADSRGDGNSQTLDQPGSVRPENGSLSLSSILSPRQKTHSQGDSLPTHVANYEILGILGRGAMGVVYRARQAGLNRLVALKMVLSGDHASQTQRERFHKEAEAIAQLQHPNIVQIHEIGEHQGCPFFSMELVEGKSLVQEIDGTPKPPTDAARMVRILAIAMQVAHEKGVIHRDLKPGNILLTLDGAPKITDFGLAKKLEEDSTATQTGTILGTPSYMAPEQADGRIEAIGPRSDVYSLGTILYELLTGRVPFKASSVLDTLEQVRTQEPIPPIQFSPSVPRDLETICLKCLSKSPDRRYQSAGELADDLTRYLEGKPILARPVSAPERFWRWCRRNPRVAVLSGVIMLAILAWGGTTSILTINLKNEKDRTLEALRVAKTNEELAKKNADEARRNEELAKKNADEARRNEELANNNAKIAKQNHAFLMNRMAKLGEQFHKQLNARRMGSTPEIRAVRNNMLGILRETILALSKDLERADITTFASAAAYQELGGLLRKFGLGEEAVAQYDQGYKVVKKVADQKPNDDVARANLGIFLWEQGDMILELRGDPAGALKKYQEGYDLQKEIAVHPKSKAYTIVDNHRLLAFGDVRLGKAELARGNPAAARRCFEEALAHRKFWVEKEPKNVKAESYLSEVYMLLGQACWRAGDDAAAKQHFEKCLEMCHNFAKRFPDGIGFKADLAEVYGNYGETQFRMGQLDDAEKSYQKSREYLAQVLNKDPDDTSRQPFTALTHDRVAKLALAQKKPEEAERRYKESLKIWEDLVQIEPNNMTWKSEYAVALAHVGKNAEAAKLSEQLGRTCPKSPEILLEIARSYGVGAGSRKEGGANKEKALQALKNVISSGWKDKRWLETDADLAALRNEMGFQQMMEHVK
jgi:serine/threonine-protein kinase